MYIGLVQKLWKKYDIPKNRTIIEIFGIGNKIAFFSFPLYIYIYIYFVNYTMLNSRYRNFFIIQSFVSDYSFLLENKKVLEK